MVDPYIAAGAKPVKQTELRGQSYGAEKKKSLADLQGQYLRNEAERLRLKQLRENPPQKPATAAQKAREEGMVAEAKKVGAAAGTARSALAGAETKSKRALDELSNLMKHPGFEAAVGAPNPFQGGFGIGTFPGTRARGFTNALDKVKAGAFLQAIEALRGTGAISEAEGKVATNALNNMSTSTSENEFKRNANEYARVITDGLSVSRKNAELGRVPFTREQLEAERQRRLKARGQ